MITRNKQLGNNKAQSGTAQAGRRGQNLIANPHPTGIRLSFTYPINKQSANLFILVGFKVLHGAVAGRLLNGGGS